MILSIVCPGLDEDNCRVVVKLTISGAIASIPQAIVNVVSRKVNMRVTELSTPYKNEQLPYLAVRVRILSTPDTSVSAEYVY